jgi:hypothetical protein
MKSLLWIGAVLSIAIVSYSMAPDIYRYMRMRAM